MVELIDIFLQRKSIQKLVAERPGLGKAILATILVTILYSIVSIFWNTLAAVILGVIGGGNPVTILITYLFFGIVMLVFTIILGIPFALVATLIMVLLHFIFAKLLGGKGTGLIQFFSLMLMLSAALMLLITIIYPLLIIPFLNLLVALALLIYCAYLEIKLIKEYFSLTTIRAILAYILPVILLIIVILILVVLIVVLLGVAAISALSSAGTGLASMPLS